MISFCIYLDLLSQILSHLLSHSQVAYFIGVQLGMKASMSAVPEESSEAAEAVQQPSSEQQQQPVSNSSESPADVQGVPLSPPPVPTLRMSDKLYLSGVTGERKLHATNQLVRLSAAFP